MNTETRFREDSMKDPETLEREINQTRAEMNQTLDSLERKLTAGQLLDQSLKFFGLKGTEIGSSVGKCIKDNPMAFFLTATGIGWMMFGPSHSQVRRYDGGYDHAQDRAGETARRAFSAAGDKIQSSAAATRQRFGEATESAKETVDRTTDRVKETFDRAADRAGDTMNRTAEIAQSQAKQARDAFNTLLEEQPLVLGALGLAVGGIIGAALPATEAEDRMLGQMSDDTTNKGKELAAQAYEKGSEVAKQNVDRVVGTASGGSSQSSDAPGA